MKKSIAALLTVLVLGLPVLALAAGQTAAKPAAKPAAAAKTVTISGELLDTACYMAHGSHGADHAECAGKCLAGGSPVSILTKKGEVILVVANHDMEDAYASAKTMGAKMVEATGTMQVRGGMKALILSSIKEQSDTMEKKM